MQDLEVAPFDLRVRNEAAALFADGFTRMRRQVPVLPGTLELPDAAATRLDGLFATCSGVMVRYEGQLLGYLGWYVLDGFRGTDRRAALSPVWGHATVPEHRADIYRALYRAACRQWSAAGCHAHAISVLASDTEGQKAWFWNGFGLTVVDAIRPTTSLGTTFLPRGPIRRATVDDADTVAALEREHRRHYAQPPVLMAVDARVDVEQIRTFLRDPVASYWLAYRDGEPVGFLRFETSVEGASDMVRSGTTVAVSGAYISPRYRRQGVATTLLNAALRDYAGRGFTRCSVDFESFNPEATSFWLQYFSPVCYSLVRVPEVVRIPESLGAQAYA